MSLIGRIAKRVRAGTARSRLEREMQEEMQAHIEQAAERFRARGMSPREALVAARREFGNVGVLQEQARDARGARWIESVNGDLRHAMRQFGRAPLLAATIVLTLALGIGVSAAGFSVLSGYLTRPAPGMPADAALVTIRGIRASDGLRSPRLVSYPEMMEYAKLPQFSEVAGWSTTMVVAKLGSDDAGSAFVSYVTPNFFRAIGVRVTEGREFFQRASAERSTPELNAVIGHYYAVAKFGTPEAAVGRTIRLNGTNVQIIGVAPPRFVGPFGEGQKEALWLPVSARPVIEQTRGDAFADWTEESFSLAARLAGDATLETAMPAVELVAGRAALARAEATGGRSRSAFTADVVPLRANSRFTTENESVGLIALITIAVALILLLCTTTVSSLLVGAGVTRRQEIAVRLAMGASRRRIIRQLLTENALLAAIAAVAGLIGYALIARGLHDTVREIDIDPTWTTAAATAGFAVLTALLCGLSPALHATRDALAGVLKDSSTNATVKSRLQRVFVVSQIALTQPLLIGLAMMIAIVMREVEFTGLMARGEYVVSAEFDTWSAAARAENRMPALVERLSALPGVQAVLPQNTGYMILKLEAPAVGGAAPQRFNIRTHEVPPGYFRSLDVPLLRGREFTKNDLTPDNRPVIIGSDFAKQAFGDVDPIGKRLAALSWDGGRRKGEMEVVGVVAPEEVGTSEEGAQLRVFTPLGGTFGAGARHDALLIRTSRPAEPLISTFQEIARTEAPMTPVRSIKTLAQVEREKRSEIIGAAGASSVGGIITLLLAAVGLYAVVALAVSQRRREIGVRVSLGATPAQVVAHFFRSGVRLSLMGLAIGLPLSAAALKLIGAQVGIPRTNMPVIAAAVAVTVVGVAALASWIPARRAAGVDPLVALRSG